MAQSTGRRGLLIIAVVLAVLLAVVDVLRPGSFLLGSAARLSGEGTEMERVIRRFQGSRAVTRPTR